MRKHYTFFIFLLTLFSATQSLIASGDDEIRVTPSPVNFPTTKVGSKSQVTITITNISAYSKPEEYRIKEVRFESGEFNVIKNLSSHPTLKFDPAGSIDILLEFVPISSGTKNTRIIIYYYDDEPYDPDSVIVDVTAVADAADASDFILYQTPNPLQFPASIAPGNSDTLPFTIKNQGKKEGILTTVEIEQAGDDFEVLDFKENIVVFAGEEKTFRVRFNPKNPSPAKRQAKITINTNTIPVPSIDVYGEVTPPPTAERLTFDEEFNFGKVKIGDTARDTVAVTNPNPFPVDVNNLRIAPKNSQLSLISGANFVIPPGETREIILEFAPTNTIPLHTLQDRPFVVFQSIGGPPPYQILIAGEGTTGGGTGGDPKKITFDKNLIFDSTFVDTSNTKSITFKNQNATSVTVVIEKFTSGSDIFTTSKSFEIPANGGSTSLRVTFTPAESKEYTDSLVFYVGNVRDTIFLKGVGKPNVNTGVEQYWATLAIGDLSAAVGEEVVLPIRISNTPSLASPWMKFRLELRFTASVLYYSTTTGGEIEIVDGERIIVINSMYDISNPGKELHRLSLQTALGDMPVGHVWITDFTWLDDAGNKIKTNTTLDTAIISILGTEGRLVNANKGRLTLTVSPNPAYSGNIQLSFSNYEPGATVKIFNTQGELIRDLSGEISAGSSSFTINCATTDIPEGAYFCRVTSGKNSIVRTIFIQK